MKQDVVKEIQEAAAKLSSGVRKEFDGAEEFYEFLKTQGTTLSLEEVKEALLDMHSPKAELELEDLDAVAGGSQVEVVNTVKNNTKKVTVGPTVVINM